MKKYILVFLSVFLVSTSVIAQSKAKTKAKPKPLDPFSVVFEAGFNLNNFSNPSSGNIAFTQAKVTTGFNLGIYGNWPLTQALSFQTGIKVTQKGSRTLADTSYYHVDATIKPMYLEIPFDLIAKFKIGRDLHLYFGAGPYIAKALGGKNDYNGTSGALGEDVPFSGKDKIIFGNNGTPLYDDTFGNMKTYDFGVNGIVALQYWKFSVSLSTDFGLTAISYGGLTPNANSQTRSASISLGFHL